MTLKAQRLPSDIRADFDKFYHDPKLTEMIKGILSLLKTDFSELENNRHYEWLTYTLCQAGKNHKDDPFAELPGMLYGMIYTAFEKLIGDYVRFMKFNDPEFFHRELGQRDAFAYLCEATDTMFASPDFNLKIIQIRDVLNITAEVIAESQALRIYVTDITPEMVSNIMNLAENDKMKLTLKTYKEYLKIEIYKYLEDYSAKAGRK